MNSLQNTLDNYLLYCNSQKMLDKKTLKAYRIDLKQFFLFLQTENVKNISQADLENYIATLHLNYKPKTAKRKIASLKAFFHYLEYRDIIDQNPFNKIRTKFREPVTLPRTIPLNSIERLLSTIYHQRDCASTPFERKYALRDIAVIELLFATGIRISELCALRPSDINLSDRVILIYGKGSKERKIQIGNDDVANILLTYKQEFAAAIQNCGHFFVNRTGQPLSDQSVRRLINKYVNLAHIDQHITPHMFRHTFATSLLEADVDIRYIQEMLGHSSINITQIYTHVAMSKQRDILTRKHPRNYFRVEG